MTRTTRVINALEMARERTAALVDGLDDAILEHSWSPMMSPLAWDLGHIAAYEDLWIAHRHGGLPLLRPELADLYDAFETPRIVRGDLDFLRGDALRAHLDEVRDRTTHVLEREGPGDGTITEMVACHELQHQETMRQTLFLAGLPGGRPGQGAAPSAAGDGWIEVPGGPFRMGAPDDRFAFDNERPRHPVELRPFRIARRPVTNATWLTFTEGGGYERREWWSDESWAWKEEYDITHPQGWHGPPVDPRQPVLHVSWFEADAFARSQAARLPTEAEWERAATSAQETLQDTAFGWEWTATEFHGYPGFVPHPYREYSAPFFDAGYRVLRGGSWATHPCLRTPTNRNWDLPQRRQIFSSVRLAQDV
ncbi:MAG TPA: SUMF1/EgtB/PvdO family nonheme iron enzyme [Solirubrobacteraceae bacterium]|nr:SUMF1/EgtB/PvdO family nonheme iron enzyme [Solirubrobacteraceae bacterium]